MLAPSPAQSDQPVYKQEPVTVSIDDLIRNAAADYGVNYKHLYATLKCESDNFRDVALQSSVPDSHGVNGRENSWGLAQIWLDPKGHPEVTKEQAINPVFAIDFAARLFATGQEHQFHCYDIQKARGWK